MERVLSRNLTRVRTLFATACVLSTLAVWSAEEFITASQNLLRGRSKSTRAAWQLSAKERVNVRKPIFWVHLHNFAGTFVCREAHKQEEVIPKEKNPEWVGCLMPGEGCSQDKRRAHCKKRLSDGYSFSMAERDVDDEDFCDDMLTGIILRDPIAAAESTLLSNQFKKAPLMYALRQQAKATKYIPHVDCLPPWDTYQHFDNFATRSLGDGYKVGLGQ
eukprot:417461-Amphidinium_carterae.1